MLLIKIEAEGVMPAHIRQKLPDKKSLRHMSTPKYANSGFNGLFIDKNRGSNTYAPTRFIQGIVHRLCGDVRPLSMATEGSNGILDNVTYDFKEDVIASSKESFRFQSKHHKKGKGFVNYHADLRGDLDSRGKVLYDTNVFGILNLGEGDLLKLWKSLEKYCPDFSKILTSDLIDNMKLLAIPTGLLAESKLNNNDGRSAIFTGIIGEGYQAWFVGSFIPVCQKQKRVLDFYSVKESSDSNIFRYNDTLEDCELKIKRYLLLYLALATLAITDPNWLKTQVNFNKGLIDYFEYLLKLRTSDNPKKVKGVKRDILISNFEYFVVLFGSTKFRQEQHSIMAGKDKILTRDLQSNIFVRSTLNSFNDRLLHEAAIKKQIEMASVADFNYGKKGVTRLISVRLVPDI